MERIESYEIEARVGDRMRSVFLQGGFFDGCKTATLIHNHHYPEVHIVSGGAAIFYIGDEKLEISDGEIVLVPSRVAHLCTVIGPLTKHRAFQIDVETDKTRRYTASRAFLDNFFSEIDEIDGEFDCTRIAGYIEIICSLLFPELAVHPKKRSDSAFIIHEFFARNYTCLSHLSDLAECLHLSEKQAARLVEAHTGKSFKQAMLEHRMSMAKHLIQCGKSFSEVGAYLGYQSYGGFYKAYVKYFGNSEENKD